MKKCPLDLSREAPPRITLNGCFKSLTIEDTADNTAALLGMFQMVPPTVNICLREPKLIGRPHGTENNFWASKCLPQDRSALPLLDKIDRIVINYHGASPQMRYSCKGFSGETSLTLELDYPWTDSAEANIGLLIKTIFGNSPNVAELTLVDMPKHMAIVTYWECLLQSLPSLRRLAVVCSCLWPVFPVEQLCQALAASKEAPLCSNIEDLAIVIGATPAYLRGEVAGGSLADILQDLCQWLIRKGTENRTRIQFNIKMTEEFSDDSEASAHASAAREQVSKILAPPLAEGFQISFEKFSPQLHE
ncbi:hypothetical protein ACG7TL_002434 [Trametes sanguinea]